MLLTAFISAVTLATSWRAPWPRVWSSQDGTYNLAVIPGKNVNNRIQPTKTRLFAFDDNGKQLELWSSEIDFYPAKVIISDDARVVFLNEYPGYSKRTAVAILNDQGKTIGRYNVGQLLTDSEFESIPGNEGLKPKVWINHAIFSSVRNLVNPPNVAPQPTVRSIGQLKNLKHEFPYALEIQTAIGKRLWFDLMTGKLAN